MTLKFGLEISLYIAFQCQKCCNRVPQSGTVKSSLRYFATFPSKYSIAAPEINFEKAELPPPSPVHARIVPASPSYFTGRPKFTDNLLELRNLLRKYLTLPTVSPGEAPRVAWKTITQYRLMVGEPIRASKYHLILEVLKRLNQVHPQVMPKELKKALETYKRAVDPYANIPTPGIIDELGRAYGVGRRKSSSAKVYLVQGDGEVAINGRSINSTFGKIHDRESALWPLKATGRMDKYNVWASVAGGGTTGQAEAITLGVAKALMVHEPMLKPALRRGQWIQDP